ncbi:hypothetical protein [Streptomyces sp. NPDC093111]|uniref:hypothetical protein n=1 Tax=Streptomyces sp. NPDC093111 TaxID=3154978 RepID=UPI00342E14B8
MNPQDHHALAEQLLTRAAGWMDADTGWKADLTGPERLAYRGADLAEAQVHATLSTLLPVLAPVDLTVCRASRDSVPLGLYTTREAARAHCEAHARRHFTGGYLGWVPDGGGDEAPEGLVVFGPGSDDDGPYKTVTGYVVTPLTVSASYDAAADE